MNFVKKLTRNHVSTWEKKMFYNKSNLVHTHLSYTNRTINKEISFLFLASAFHRWMIHLFEWAAAKVLNQRMKKSKILHPNNLVQKLKLLPCQTWDRIHPSFLELSERGKRGRRKNLNYSYNQTWRKENKFMINYAMFTLSSHHLLKKFCSLATKVYRVWIVWYESGENLHKISSLSEFDVNERTRVKVSTVFEDDF